MTAEPSGRKSKTDSNPGVSHTIVSMTKRQANPEIQAMKYHLSYRHRISSKTKVEELTVSEPKLTDSFLAFSKKTHSPFTQYELPVSKRGNQFTSSSPYGEISKSEACLLLVIVLSQGNVSFKMFIVTFNCLSSSFLAYLINNLDYK